MRRPPIEFHIVQSFEAAGRLKGEAGDLSRPFPSSPQRDLGNGKRLRKLPIDTTALKRGVNRTHTAMP